MIKFRFQQFRLALAIVTAMSLSLLTTSASAQDVKKVTSPKGVVAWLVESRTTPLVSMKIYFKGGGFQDPPDKPGLASMMAYAMNEGAGEMTAQDFLNRRDRIGAEFHGTASAEVVTVSFSTVTDHRDEAVELMVLAMARPRFDDEPLARAKQYYRNSYEATMRNPHSKGGEAFRQLIYGRHRTSTPTSDFIAALDRITTGDIRAMRQRIIARDNAVVGVVGDIDPATLGAWLDRIFDALPEKAELAPEPRPAYAGPKRQVIDMDIPQALVLFGNLTTELSPRERIVAQLLDNIASASFTGRLFTEVREKRGLVYSISTGYGYTRLADAYSGSFGSGNATVASALDVTLGVLKRLAEEGPTEDEMANYKSAIVGQHLFGIEGSASLAGWLASVQLRKLPIDYIPNYVAMLQSVETAEVKALAAKLIKPDQFSVVVVGRPNPPVPLQ